VDVVVAGAGKWPLSIRTYSRRITPQFLIVKGAGGQGAELKVMVMKKSSVES